MPDESSGAVPQNASHKRAAFLAAYAQTGNITAAAHAAGCSPSTHRHVWMKQPDYPALFAEAQEQAVELMEAEALRRATRGIEEPVFHRGKQCGSIRKYSDTLLIFLLKAARPKKYRDRHEHSISGPGGGPIVTAAVVGDELRQVTTEALADPSVLEALLVVSEAVARGNVGHQSNTDERTDHALSERT